MSGARCIGTALTLGSAIVAISMISSAPNDADARKLSGPRRRDALFP
jgi:hypothetical protein